MVFDPLQLFFGGACVLTLVTLMCPVCLVVLASAVFSYMVGAGVGLSVAVGPRIVVRAPERAPASRARHNLVPALLVLLLVVAGPVHAKQALATLNVSVTVLGSCAVSTDQRVATTCTASTPPTVEQREQGTGPGQMQLTVVTF
ncbi:MULTISPECIES: hypothetical protein [Burkholderiaceae]|uniref:hypothetical protein n=1 Tax=Burkholderiaceae TaxID=119060 RepID=UPI0016131704|nr:MULTISPECIES: hypothetical protein [Burkholderiaceae]MBB2981588.1 hypothetical protein [Paraburkholderia tropica]